LKTLQKLTIEIGFGLPHTIFGVVDKLIAQYLVIYSDKLLDFNFKILYPRLVTKMGYFYPLETKEKLNGNYLFKK
jgi:hypothetical protein